MQNKNYQKKEQQAKTTRCPKCNETYSVRMITNSGSGNAEYFCSECAIEFRTTKGEMKVWNLSMQGKMSVAV
jgi:transcription elongation factor Elf1